jgi:predicted secreted protein
MVENADRLFVRAGEEIEISLSMVPASGYDWHLDSQPRGIEFIADRYVRPVDDESSVGGTGSHVFRFRAAAAGTFTVAFILKRTWENTGIRKRVFQIHVSDNTS